MSLVITAILLIIGIALLVKSADYFTESAEKIGLFFGISPFVVGITIVAFGTSLPELISSTVAVFQGAAEIVVGNVVGSNIANIFLVLGLAGLVRHKMPLKREHLKVDLALLAGSAVILALFIWDRNFTIIEAIVSLVFMLIYILLSLKEKQSTKHVRHPLGKWTLPVLVISGVGIYFGAKLTVESVVVISEALGIGADIISSSVVAFGTSLPEIAVSFVAAKKGSAEVAFGNVLGSNVFNSLFVMGIPRLFGEYVITSKMITFTLPVMMLATFLVILFTYDKKLLRKEAIIFCLLYGGYLFFLF